MAVKELKKIFTIAMDFLSSLHRMVPSLTAGVFSSDSITTTWTSVKEYVTVDSGPFSSGVKSEY